MLDVLLGILLAGHLLLAPLPQARVPGPGGSAPASVATWTLVQQVWDRAAYTPVGQEACVTNVCTLAVASTGSGHGLIIYNYETNEVGTPTITGGCASWVSAPTGGSVGTGPVGQGSIAYCLSSSSGATSIVITFPTTPGDASVVFVEAAWSGSSIAADGTTPCGNRSTGTLETNPAGVTLTGVSGTTDFILQTSASSASPATAASSPFNTNFRNTSNSGTPGTLAEWAGSFFINGTATSVPTWTAANARNINLACALKGT